ncbi:hypothetical protein [Actinacidiphila yanglinensis]|uniref:hypothetical protein n=1 Tax=Actinacidiphila yanglinensis TaxID=310779 RepID=UPI0011AFE10E|nr:hypothetical protein [Actinacidiphila yanglinensis]
MFTRVAYGVFAAAGVLAQVDPGVDPSLPSRAVAATFFTGCAWLFLQVGSMLVIRLEAGVISVHYPLMVRRVRVEDVSRVVVDRGDLVIETVDGQRIRPPIFRGNIRHRHRGGHHARRLLLRCMTEAATVHHPPVRAWSPHLMLPFLLVPLLLDGALALLLGQGA